MPNPVSGWTEDDVLALPAGENDSFERKGSMSLDLKLPKVNEDAVLNELAKQLSAFANASGGQIIYGLANNGTVDGGGVALSVKGRQSTKEWLEDVIPKLTEFEIMGFNVYPIEPNGSQSHIAPGKALFVVDVPASDRAPHQSKRDQKYYVRLGGKSQPAPHRMIEDIRNRQKHPLLKLSCDRIEVSEIPGAGYTNRVPNIEGEVRIDFHFSIGNIGHVMARNTCFQIESSIAMRWWAYDNSTVRQRGQHEPIFWEIKDPIYPSMKIGFFISARLPVRYGLISDDVPQGGPWLLDSKRPAEAQLRWWLFADNAPAKEGGVTMEDLGFEKAAGVAVDKHPNRGIIRLTYKSMP